MIADQITKTDKSLKDRGLPMDSYFEVTFKDGSVVNEKTVNWSSFSKIKVVKHGTKNVAVHISNFPIKEIVIHLDYMIASLENIPDDIQVYQFIRTERLLARDIDKQQIVGRGIGLVKDGVIIEEKIIDHLSSKITGVKI
jgi:hypothetical protein